jgi:hypothetical protein
MMDIDDQLEAMRAAWRAAPVGDLSVNQLRAQVRQEQRVLRRETWLEALVSLAMSGVFAVWASRAEGVAQTIFIGLAVFAIAWPAITIQLRRKVWRMQADTVEAYRSFPNRPFPCETGLYGRAAGPCHRAWPWKGWSAAERWRSEPSGCHLDRGGCLRSIVWMEHTRGP